MVVVEKNNGMVEEASELEEAESGSSMVEVGSAPVAAESGSSKAL